MHRQIVSASKRRRLSIAATRGMESLEPRQLLAFVGYNVNFQPASSAPVSGWTPDNGAIFGTRANGQQFGWNVDNSDNTRVRNINPNPLNDRFIHVQRNGSFIWEYALPNGNYDIEVGAGDPGYSDQINHFQVENREVDAPTNGFAGARVTVTDGRLTVSAGPGASNAKLNYISITTAETTPHAAPSDLKVVAQTNASVVLTWKNNSPAADEFIIERRKAGETNWSVAGTVSSSLTSFTDLGVSAVNTYEYRVFAASPGQIPSDKSNVVSVTVLDASNNFESVDIGSPQQAGSTEVLAPGVDYGIYAGGTDVWGKSDQFRFVYKPVTGNFDYSVRIANITRANAGSMAGLMARESLSADSRHIFMRARAGDGMRANYRPTTGGDSLGVGNFIGTFPNEYVRLQRVGNVFTAYASNNGTTWTVITQQTLNLPSTLYFGMAASARTTAEFTYTGASFRGLTDRLAAATKPAAPSNLVATTLQSPYGTLLSWRDNASNEGGFRIERKFGSSWISIGNVDSNMTNFLVLGDSASSVYTYRVVAVNAFGTSVSNEVTYQQAVQLPGMITNVTAENTGEGVFVRWNGAASGGYPDGFIVQRSGGGATVEISPDVYGRYIDASVINGVEYSYRVIAYNASGQSPISNPATIVAQKATAVPTAPTDLQLKITGAGVVTLKWVRNANDAVGIRIERRVAGTTAWQLFVDYPQFGGGQNGYLDESVVAGTTYEYRVFFQNSLGLSDPSNIASIAIPLATGFASYNVGITGGSTNAVVDGRDYDVTGGGADIWGKSDQFRFVAKQITGNFDIRVRVDGISLADVQSMGGLMARASLAADSQNIFVKARADGKNRLTYRTTNGGDSIGYGGSTGKLPQLLRLTRFGDTFAAMVSSDGVYWSTINEITIDMPDTIYVGLAASSHATAATTVKFRDLALYESNAAAGVVA